MFLLGAWFIRSGLMAQPAAHLDFYRKMAMFGIPFGIGLIDRRRRRSPPRTCAA